MKKIIINENQLNQMSIMKELPVHINDNIDNCNLKCFSHPLYPSNEKLQFVKNLINVGYNDKCDAVNQIPDFNNKMNDIELRDYTQNLINEIITIERPHREVLSDLCRNIVLDYFNLLNHQDEVTLKCSLVDSLDLPNEIEYKDIDINNITFNQASDIDDLHLHVDKYGLILALIEGASHNQLGLLTKCNEYLLKIDMRLPYLYYEVMTLINHLTFNGVVENETITNHELSCCNIDFSETMLFDVQGLLFPLLLKETIYNMLKMLSLSALPINNEYIEYILTKTHDSSKECWYERIGLGLWELIFGDVDEKELTNIPQLFCDLIMLPNNKFNDVLKELLLKTKRGSIIKQKLLSKINNKKQYNSLLDKINQRNSNNGDIYFKSGDL